MGINVLSLFDGASGGMQALERAGIQVENYFASEIDKYAIQVSSKNYPNIIQIGDVRNIKASDLPPIQLLCGGSPCQSFSFLGKRNGMTTKDSQEILTLSHYLQLKEEGFEFEGQSYLFWEYMRVLNEVKPDFFLLENVMMVEKWKKTLTTAIGVEPVMINSSLVSAQNRKRLYWCNIGATKVEGSDILLSGITQPEDKGILLKDILEDNVDEKYFLGQKMLDYFNRNTKIQKEVGNGFSFNPTEGESKAKPVTTKEGNRMGDNFIIVHNLQTRSENRPSIVKNKNAGGSGPLSKQDGKSYCLDTANLQAVELPSNNDSNTDIKIRRLTPIECERLQTMEDGFTDGISNTQRYRILGNGWTIDVIAHIFSHMPMYYQNFKQKD